MRTLLLFSLFVSAESFLRQSVAIKGRLLCGNRPLFQTRVKLWNKNTFGRDDLLAESHTDGGGNFELHGGVKALFPMSVHFKVYHDCEDGIKPCQRKVTLPIPDSAVARSDSPDQVFDVGTLNMITRYPEETRSCIN